MKSTEAPKNVMWRCLDCPETRVGAPIWEAATHVDLTGHSVRFTRTEVIDLAPEDNTRQKRG